MPGDRVGGWVYPSHPPTPPYIRVRIRRFMVHAGAAVLYPVPTPALIDQNVALALHGSCARLRYSTGVPDRSPPISIPVPPRVRTFSVGARVCEAVSTAATTGTAAYGTISRPFPETPRPHAPAAPVFRTPRSSARRIFERPKTASSSAGSAFVRATPISRCSARPVPRPGSARLPTPATGASASAVITP